MKIYLKGYYWYKNFGDELLLFGVIEEIFSRYTVEKLVIEVGDTDRIKERVSKNISFLKKFYHSKGIRIDWGKIYYFNTEEYFKNKQFWFSKFLPKKRNTYIHIILGKHPFRKYFKIFGGWEVIDETRHFPHNWRNLILLYTKSILNGNFALWWGLGSQKSLLTRWLTNLLVRKANHTLLREPHSLHICQHILGEKCQKIELYHDFSLDLIYYRKSQTTISSNNFILINLSPSLNSKKRWKIKEKIKDSDLIYFPCDLNFDLKNITEKTTTCEQNQIFIWTNHNLDTIFKTLSTCSEGIGSRLHFLYCLQQLWKKITPLSNNSKITYNL